MKHILNNSLIVLYITISTCCCTTKLNPKAGLFEAHFDGEDKYLCVMFLHQKDTIVYCGFVRSLYMTLQPNIEEYEFYKKCANTDVSPIPIDSIELGLLKENVFYLDEFDKLTSTNDSINIEEQKKGVLDYLNSNKPITRDILFDIYQCWINNIIFTTDDEVGDDYWFAYSLK